MPADTLLLDIERVAHGGVCVGHAPDGRVVFVRHAVPGERVRVVVTDERRSYVRADTVEVVEASPSRVRPPCPWAGPGRCGGCDWQHVELAEQRRLKAAVIREQLRRLARLDVDVEVEAVEGVADGLGWRTRMQLAVDSHGRAGLRRHRSHDVEPIDDCLIAHPRIATGDVVTTRWSGAESVEVEVSSTGERRAVAQPAEPVDAFLTEHAAGRSWQVPVGGFWQVHPAAADVLARTVDELAQVRAGDRCLDLYAGVGLFTGVLAERTDVPVVSVEHDTRASAAAAVNVPGAKVVTARVERWLPREQASYDVVVLDPPRRGAGAVVVESIAATAPRRICYVACDPASLSRDVANFAGLGFELTALRAFDLFPMTAHVECVALLEKS